MATLQDFMENIMRMGLEYYRRFHGPYRAEVISNQDPESIGRILIECPRAKFGKDNANWVYPMMAGAGKSRGFFWPPEKGDYVWVFFDNGDPTHPATYMGGWFAPDEVDEAFDTDDDAIPRRRGFQTPGGHRVVLDDTTDVERITIEHKDGTIIQWTEDKTIKLGKKDGSFEPLVRGNAWKRWAETHTHPHSWGPTLPPTEPIPSDVLSSDTETS